MKKEKLPDTELRVMQAIWHMDAPASTSEIREELQKERPWNLSALQTLLGRLVGRGFLSTEKNGKNRYYTPLVAEEESCGGQPPLFPEMAGRHTAGFGGLLI